MSIHDRNQGRELGGVLEEWRLIKWGSGGCKPPLRSLSYPDQGLVPEPEDMMMLTQAPLPLSAPGASRFALPDALWGAGNQTCCMLSLCLTWIVSMGSCFERPWVHCPSTLGTRQPEGRRMAAPPHSTPRVLGTLVPCEISSPVAPGPVALSDEELEAPGSVLNTS